MAASSLTFLGATGTVTGSKHLLDTGDAQVLVDCGLFQGFKALRLRNWQHLPLPVRQLDAVVLTHAHLDHSGYLPRLVHEGFRGPVYCTRSTAALCRLLLPDAAYLQELDAEYANRRGFSRHHPALPLFTQEDATRALSLLREVDFGDRVDLPGHMRATMSRAGHLLGAASIRVEVGGRSLVFSGDLGRDDDILMDPPEPRPDADIVVLESTYGDRLHPAGDPDEALAAVIRRTVERGGSVVVPAFAVGRIQALLVILERLVSSGRIPDVPIFLDSPMASAATEIYQRRARDHRLDHATCAAAFARPTYVQSVDDSKALDRRREPMILLSASGMATGGRVVHHLKQFAPDANNTILFAGFQAAGTRGAALVGGAREIKIHGAYVPVRAEVVQLDTLSAHADQTELIAWLGKGKRPERIFLVHGEPQATDTLRLKIQEQLGWTAEVPDYRDSIAL